MTALEKPAATVHGRLILSSDRHPISIYPQLQVSDSLDLIPISGLENSAAHFSMNYIPGG
jgi:hypothetical protein